MNKFDSLVCIAEGCDAPAAGECWFCRRHWRELPPALRQLVIRMTVVVHANPKSAAAAAAATFALNRARAHLAATEGHTAALFASLVGKVGGA